MPAIAHLVELASRSADSPVIQDPLASSSFSLDSSGVAGFFGGDSAVTGIATIQLFAARRWGGWYNAPGAYEIAKRYGQLANSRLWDGLFPGAKREPAELFELDGQIGPSFHAARSGSSIRDTGHLAYLVARKAADLPARDIPGRETRPETVTVIDLGHAPPDTIEPRRLAAHCGLFSILPISASLAACVLCALVADWWSFASIALGILANGVTCLVIGSGRLTFSHPTPATGAPRGDGILVDEKSSSVIVLRGEEGAVNTLTRGRFSLEYDGQPRYSAIGHCSVLLTIQFITQLLLIPQGQLIGQILFVVTLAASWAYNTYLSSMDREELQTQILLDLIHLQERDLRKFRLGTRTAMAVFTCLSLQPPDRPLHSAHKLLDEMIPNDTEVWQQWKRLVAQKLRARDMSFTPEDLLQVQGLDAQEQELLGRLLKDAEEACSGWREAFASPLASASSSPRQAKMTPCL